MLGLMWYNWPDKCDVIQTINASITVKDIGSRAFIGLNTDRDALKFGSVSPFTLATRKVTVQHTENSRVFVKMVGTKEEILKDIMLKMKLERRGVLRLISKRLVTIQ